MLLRGELSESNWARLKSPLAERRWARRRRQLWRMADNAHAKFSSYGLETIWHVQAPLTPLSIHMSLLIFTYRGAILCKFLPHWKFSSIFQNLSNKFFIKIQDHYKQ